MPKDMYMTDEEQKGICLTGLEEALNYAEDEIEIDYEYNPRNKEYIKELSWEIHTYKELYSRLEASDSPFFEDIIGDFQSDMLECSRHNKKNSYIFMYMFNVASEYLEYIWTIIEDEVEYRKEKELE